MSALLYTVCADIEEMIFVLTDSPVSFAIYVLICRFIMQPCISRKKKKKKILHRQLGPLRDSSSLFSPLNRRGLNPYTQYNLSVESNQNAESKRQSVESKMGK